MTAHLTDTLIDPAITTLDALAQQLPTDEGRAMLYGVAERLLHIGQAANANNEAVRLWTSVSSHCHEAHKRFVKIKSGLIFTPEARSIVCRILGWSVTDPAEHMNCMATFFDAYSNGRPDVMAARCIVLPCVEALHRQHDLIAQFTAEMPELPEVVLFSEQARVILGELIGWEVLDNALWRDSFEHVQRDLEVVKFLCQVLAAPQNRGRYRNWSVVDELFACNHAATRIALVRQLRARFGFSETSVPFQPRFLSQ